MRVMFENISEDDKLQLIQRFNCEWKIGPKVFLDFAILTPQIGGHISKQSINLGWYMPRVPP